MVIYPTCINWKREWRKCFPFKMLIPSLLSKTLRPRYEIIVVFFMRELCSGGTLILIISDNKNLE